jgi:ADP-ribosylglycohydrolase
MLTPQQKGLIYGAFIGDALALGPHWIYDTDLIKQQFKPLQDFQKPGTPYHPHKEAGDFTHYGDQTELLLEHLASHQHLDLVEFKEAWLNLMASGTLYLDHATKDSILKLSNQNCFTGSDSLELGGLVRSAPLFALTNTTLDDLLDQTHLTHNAPVLNDIADFTYSLLKLILAGTSPSKSINDLYLVASDSIKPFIHQALSLLEVDPVVAIKEIGQSCSAEFGFPASLYLILSYGDNFEEALIQNAYAGGDSAARGMYVGMVLGAYHGFDTLPARWVNGLNHKKRIEDALSAFS